MTRDMTEGRITPLLIGFTLPLILGNIFQLLYNAVDSIIVGKFVGEGALAAVGTCNPLVTLAILFISGLCMGAGILMGMHYGAGDYELLQRQISSTMIGGLVFSGVFAMACILFAPALLHLIKAQDAVMDVAVSYLRIILCGLVFTFVYNFYANVLRALGDARTPLYFLMISAVFNILGDLVFVVAFKMGSNGCAIATVISEGISCLLCGLYIKRKVPVLCLGKKWFVFDKDLFFRTVQYGWTSAMQQATVQLGKIGIQIIVNTMGVPVMAAFAAVNRIDDFAYTPQQNIGHAMTAFLAQNKGAGKKDRIRKGFQSGMMIETVYGLCVCLVCFLFARPLMQLFVNDAEIVDLGVTYLHLIAAMYILPAFTNGIQGFFRGIGDLKVTFISSLVNMGVRVISALPFVYFFQMGIKALPLAYLCGWAAMLLAEVPLLVRQIRSLK
ncbi:MAG: MATE family efflux transporter [Suilimivivens sp.]